MLWGFLGISAIGAIIYLGLAAIECFLKRKNYKKYAREKARIAGMCLTSFLIVFIAIILVKSLDYKETVQTGEYELIPLQGNTVIYNGQEYYVHVGSQVVSYYCSKDDKKTVATKDVVIVEEDECIPHVVEYAVKQKNLLGDVLKWMLISEMHFSVKMSEVYVPQGTAYYQNK